MNCPMCTQKMVTQTVTTDQFAPWGGHTQIEEDIWHCEGCEHQEPIDDYEL